MTDERIRVGFVGCGGISRLYADIYASLVDIAQVVAVADFVDELAERKRTTLSEGYAMEARQARMMLSETRSPEERGRLQQRVETAEAAAKTKIRKYGSHEELLRDSDVQVMVLLTTPPVRQEPTVAAAETGRHVFTQGPMACSVAEADAMTAAVRKAGVKFHSQCGARYPRGMVLARKAVESGKLGKIGSARVELNWFRPQSYYKRWHGTWEGEGGGASFHHGRYILDPFLWVLGSRIEEIFAYSGPALREIEHESLSQAVVKFDNGTTGSIHASLLNHKQSLTPEGRIEVLGYDASMLVGEAYYSPPLNTTLGRNNYWQADTTFASNDNPAAVNALENLRSEVASVPETATEAYQSRLFLESIADDTEPLVPIDVPRHHVEVVRAMYKSTEERLPVTLPLDKDDPFYNTAGKLTHGVKRAQV